jgi:hypothetical protein
MVRLPQPVRHKAIAIAAAQHWARCARHDRVNEQRPMQVTNRIRCAQ